jgi:hypothetical protein
MKLIFATSLLSLGRITAGTLLDKCEFDCDLDKDCKQGLWCADEHKAELKAKGFDERKANCGNVGAWNLEVCFDPAILQPSAGGGGGTYYNCYNMLLQVLSLTSFVGICDLTLP